MATTLAQQKALAIAPKFTSFSSIIGSGIICFLILKRSPEKKTFHRLILGMSICDLFASTAWFFTTWPIPAGTPGVYGAVGTQQTCSTQAFFAQFSLSTVMYNLSLAIYFVMAVVKGKNEVAISRVEPFLHANAILWGLGTAIASLVLTLFNQVGWDCWISPYPLGCKETWQLAEGETSTCERGDNATLFQWAFYYGPLWTVIIIVSVLQYWVYYFVHSIENKMKKYTYTTLASSSTSTASSLLPNQSFMRSYSDRVAEQASYYVGAFLIAWLFPTIFQLSIVISSGTYLFPLLFLQALFVPIQGILNLIVFVHPKLLKYRDRNPNDNVLVAWFRMLGSEISGNR